nr:MAG TPA: hypothetical protein [Caudoviricetes sp.]
MPSVALIMAGIYLTSIFPPQSHLSTAVWLTPQALAREDCPLQSATACLIPFIKLPIKLKFEIY